MKTISKEHIPHFSKDRGRFVAIVSNEKGQIYYTQIGLKPSGSAVIIHEVVQQEDFEPIVVNGEQISGTDFLNGINDVFSDPIIDFVATVENASKPVKP